MADMVAEVEAAANSMDRLKVRAVFIMRAAVVEEDIRRFTIIRRRVVVEDIIRAGQEVERIIAMRRRSLIPATPDRIRVANIARQQCPL